jgi:hypothetical protein
MKRLALLTAIVCLAVLPAGAATLDVNATAAITGNYGLEVQFNGTTQGAYVVDTTPTDESVYTAEFNVTQPDSFDFELYLPQATPADRQKCHHMMFAVKDMDNTPPDRLFSSVHLKKVDWGGGNLRYVVWTRFYAPTDSMAAGDGWVYRSHLGEAMEVAFPTHISGYPVSIRFIYSEETSAGANDGKWCIYRANNFAPGVYAGRCHETLSSYGHNIDQVEMGAPGGVDTGTVGSHYFDDFVSTRSDATP